MIIADFGSGNTCKNDVDYAKRMIDELAKIDSDRKVTIKWQLFEQRTVPYCVPLTVYTFDAAYWYAHNLGYETTASVFDKWSLSLLKHYTVPFIKLACRGWVYPLIGAAADSQEFIVSCPSVDTISHLQQEWDVRTMCCISEYPADMAAYQRQFGDTLKRGISDHTTDFRMYHLYNPDIYERHFKLEDSEGPDAGPFAMTPKQWGEIL